MMADGVREYVVAGAIAAHLWHMDWLSSEISACVLGQRPDGVAPIELCDFGRWLRDIAPRSDDAARHRTCQRLHTELHAEACEALRLVSVERLEEAQAAMAPEGRVAAESKRLTGAMMTWWSSSKVR